MAQGLLNTLGAVDAENFTPADGVELVMPNPPPDQGTFPKAWIPNESGIVRVTLLSGELKNVPVVQGIPVNLTVTTFEENGTTVAITDILGML